MAESVDGIKQPHNIATLADSTRSTDVTTYAYNSPHLITHTLDYILKLLIPAAVFESKCILADRAVTAAATQPGCKLLPKAHKADAQADEQ
jgi:hypothetical protein